MMDQVLQVLLANYDRFISGEDISQGLGVTRAAVWKHINRLKGEGFTIESISNRGYRLTHIPDIFNKEIIDYRLTTEVMGRNMEINSSIPSTNGRARELASQGADEGTLVLAEQQTAGRGRRGRTWTSLPEKGIWASLILRPDMAPEYAPRITVIAALSLILALNGIDGLEPWIKWPNDIIIDGGKICGILTEIQSDLENIEYVVLGMGINVNFNRVDFPSELKKSAGSIMISRGEYTNRTALLADILKEFEQLYFSYLSNGDFSYILKLYRKHLLTLNKRVRVHGRDFQFEGMAVDILEDGSLCVKDDEGTRHRVLSGDVTIRGIDGYV